MGAFVLILAIAMPSYDGGVGLHSVYFYTREACDHAARVWNNTSVSTKRGQIVATCLPTGKSV